MRPNDRDPSLQTDVPAPVIAGDASAPAALTSTPAAAARIGAGATAARVGRELAAQMEARGYHPVVVFGSSASGKSSLLASLLAYLQVEAGTGIQVSLGEPFVLDDDSYARWAHHEATGFFYRSVEEFIGGRAHAATMSPHPFFIPVVLKPEGSLPEVRLAFLESRGDWYNPDADRHEFFPRLREEISSVLLNFQKGASFLHLAPYTQVVTWDEAAASQQARDAALRQQADLALVGALNAYKSTRVVKHRDAHLLLLTKWDACAAPGTVDGRFSAPRLEDVVAVLRERHPRSFVAFMNLELEAGATWQKQVMQYCAGLISGRSILHPTGDVRDQLQRYPRVLWSWLYANATRDAGAERSLFAKPPVPRPGVADRFNRALAAALRFIGV